MAMRICAGLWKPTWWARMSISYQMKGPLLRAAPSFQTKPMLLLLPWGVLPKFVGQQHAHRVNIDVVIEFEASAAQAAGSILEGNSPVVIVKPREAILGAQRPVAAQPSQLCFDARAQKPSIAVTAERAAVLVTINVQERKVAVDRKSSPARRGVQKRCRARQKAEPAVHDLGAPMPNGKRCDDPACSQFLGLGEACFDAAPCAAR